MGSVDRFPDLLPSSAEDDKLRTISQSQTLTPRLCVVVAVIYMIAVALGFAALENTLFLLSPLGGSTMLETIMTGNLRFVGATLLHVLCSAVVGLALAFSFYKKGLAHVVPVAIGVILASLLHAGFNFLILNAPEEYLLRTFSIVWFGVVVVLAGVEFVKRIRPRWR